MGEVGFGGLSEAMSAGAAALTYDRLGGTGTQHQARPDQPVCRNYCRTPAMSTMPTIRLPGGTT